MNKKISKISIVIIIIALIIGFMYPNLYERQCMNRVYPELEKNLNNSIYNATIRIMLLNEETDDNVTYMDIKYKGCGTIYKKDKNNYYVLTAAHVVNELDKTESLYIVPYHEDTYSNQKNKSKTYLSLEDYVDKQSKATVEYISNKSDVAILKFSSKKSYSTMNLSNNNLKYHDQLLAFGQNEKNENTINYGKITSKKLKTFKTSDGKIDTVQHMNAYVTYGYSGGAILNEHYELSGMIIGGGTTILHKFTFGAIVPISTIQEEISNYNLANS